MAPLPLELLLPPPLLLLLLGPALVEPVEPHVRCRRCCHSFISILRSALSLRHALTRAPSNRTAADGAAAPGAARRAAP